MSVSSRIEKTKSKCHVCGGAIVVKTVTVYDPETGTPIYGPGSKRQYKNIHGGYYCEKCGIKYEFLPEEG